MITVGEVRCFLCSQKCATDYLHTTNPTPDDLIYHCVCIDQHNTGFMMWRDGAISIDLPQTKNWYVMIEPKHNAWSINFWRGATLSFQGQLNLQDYTPETLYLKLNNLLILA